MYIYEKFIVHPCIQYCNLSLSDLKVMQRNMKSGVTYSKKMFYLFASDHVVIYITSIAA